MICVNINLINKIDGAYHISFCSKVVIFEWELLR